MGEEGRTIKYIKSQIYEIVSVIKFIRNMGMVDTIACIAGTKLNIIFLLIIRKYSVQMFSQCIQWQTRYSIIITVYFFDQAASYTLKTIPSCFIPEIIFLDSKDKLRNIILTIIITS